MSQQHFHPPPPGPPPGQAPQRRRTTAWVVALLLLALVAGGVTAFVVLRDSGDSSDASTQGGTEGGTEGGEDDSGDDEEGTDYAVTPVTEAPTLDWKWSRGGATNLTSLGRGGILLVGFQGDEPGIVRLDDEGEEMWHRAGESALLWIDEQHDRVFVAADGPTGFLVLDTETGGELWRNDDLWLHDFFDDGHVLAIAPPDSPQWPTGVVLDPEGEQVWETSGKVEMLENDVVRNRGSHVARLDGLTGEELWEKEVAVQPESSTGFAHLGVATGLVVVLGDDALVGLDSEFGEELWDKPKAADFTWVGGFTPDLVAVAKPAVKGRFARALLVSRDGILTRHRFVQMEEQLTFYGRAFRSDGKVYGFSDTSWAIYDERGAQIRQVWSLADLRPAGTGYYTFDEYGDIEYYTFDEDEARWAVEVPGTDDLTELLPQDGWFAVVVGDEIQSWR